MRCGILCALVLLGCGQPRNTTITEPAVTVNTTSGADARLPDATAGDAAPPHDGGKAVADAHTSDAHVSDARAATDAATRPSPDARAPSDAAFPRSDAGRPRADAGVLKDAGIVPKTYDLP